MWRILYAEKKTEYRSLIIRKNFEKWLLLQIWSEKTKVSSNVCKEYPKLIVIFAAFTS